LGKSILAKRDTWLKRKPVDSSTLAAEEKLFVPKGAAWQWTEIRMYAGEVHQRVILELQPDKEWWFFPDHWKIINDVNIESSEPSTKNEIKLSVPYYSQRDNYRDANRTCFSSSCAMLLSGLDPDAIENDDDYIREVFKIGDTTDSSVQVKALAHFGVESSFLTTGDWSSIEERLEKGIPVPIGILHKGSVSKPSGGGHWICVVGVTADRSKLWVHDPWGDLDLVAGTYVSQDGEYKLYSKANLGPRWMVEGNKSGWFIKAL